MGIRDREEKASMKKLSVKSLLGCDNRQVKKSTQIVFALATAILFILLLTIVIMQAIILDTELDYDDSGDSSESNPDETFESGSEKCIARDCHLFCVNLSLTRLIEISIKKAAKELKNCMDISLVLQFINFDKRTIPNYWLQDMTKPISSIQIIGGNLRYISPDAFKGDTFYNLQLIFINALTIMRLNEHSFSGARNLQQLKITQVEFLKLTANTFQSLKTSIKTLSIEDCGDWDPRLISSTALSDLERANFRFNDFKGKHLNRLSLRGVKSTQVLNLASSNIVSLEDGVFDEFENLLYINLNGNHLQTLPPHIFDRLVANNIGVAFDIHMNPWHCDCRLDFLRKLALNNYTIIIPRCFSPKTLSDLDFHSIESFCIGNEVEYHTGPHGNDLDPGGDVVTPTSCKMNTNIQSPDQIIRNDGNISVNFTDGFKEFDILDEPQSSIRINFTENLNRKYNLFWFPLISDSVLPDIVSCIPRITGNVVLEDFHHDVYLFCLLDVNETIITSSHCKIHIRSVRGSSLSWLTMSQTATLMCIFALSILSCLVFCALAVYLAICNNPVLLRTSKRVNIVKRRTGEVYIMPTKLHKMIPTELKDTRRDRKSSKISTFSYKSGASYISTIETTESQLGTWGVRNASCSFEPQLTSVYVKEDQSDRRYLSDYPGELGAGFRKERSSVTTLFNSKV